MFIKLGPTRELNKPRVTSISNIIIIIIIIIRDSQIKYDKIVNIEIC